MWRAKSPRANRHIFCCFPKVPRASVTIFTAPQTPHSRPGGQGFSSGAVGAVGREGKGAGEALSGVSLRWPHRTPGATLSVTGAAILGRWRVLQVIKKRPRSEAFRGVAVSLPGAAGRVTTRRSLMSMQQNFMPAQTTENEPEH